LEKRLRLPYVAVVLSLLLPYGVIEGPSWIGTIVQQWLFPFWEIVNVSGTHNYRAFHFLFPFPWYEFPLVLLGLMWFILGLSTSKLLQELYMGRIQRRFFILLLLGALASQYIMTYLMLYHVYIFTLDYVLPWPVHTLLVLSLAVLYKKAQ
jgi:hypothetical protein